MGIERQMEFDFSMGEKLKLAKEFNIVPSEENLANLEKIDGKWYFKGLSVDEKLVIAKEFNIVPSEENLANLEKVDGKWYLKGLSVEGVEKMYEDKDEYWK